MLKLATVTNREKKCLQSWMSRPKKRRGSRICFSWTWKEKRKKAIETLNIASRNYLLLGVLIKYKREGRQAVMVATAAILICAGWS